MGTKERRERERQDLRQKIKDAARELFSTRGYEAVTMREIAERIEYSPTAIYLHFPDKETLVKELCNEDFLAFAKEFQKAANVADPRERMQAIGRIYIQFGLQYPNHYRLMFMSSHPQSTPDEAKCRQGDPEQDAYAMLRNTVVACMEAGCFRPEIKDVDVLAQTLWAAMHGIVALQLSFASDPWIQMRSAQELGRSMMDALFRGIAAERSQ